MVKTIPKTLIFTLLHLIVTITLYYNLQLEKTKFSAYKSKQSGIYEVLKDKYDRAEKRLERATAQNETKLKEIKDEYEQTIIDVSSSYDDRLLDLEERLAYYDSLPSNGEGSSACRDIISRTARLDRSLEEGRHLVIQLRERLTLREEQLTIIGQQLRIE